MDAPAEQRAVEAAFRRLRAELGDVAGENQVRAWLFSALGAWGPSIPSNRTELTQFVRGALRRVLSEKVDRQELPFLLIQLENAIAIVDSEDAQAPSPRPSNRPPLSAPDATWALSPIVPGRIHLLVISSHRHLGDTLRLALGPDSFSVEFVSTLDGTVDLTRTDIVLIDGRQPPTLEPVNLVAALRSIPPRTLITVWASEDAYGRAVTQALAATGIPGVPLISSEGIAPFLDLARSRMG